MRAPFTAKTLQVLDRPLWAFFIALGLLLIVNELVGRLVFDAMDRTYHEQMEAQHTETTLVELLSAFKDAETGQRGYLLAGAPAYLNPYYSARKQIDGYLEQLHVEFSKDPELLKLMDQLAEVARAKQAEMAYTISLYDHRRSAEAQSVINTGKGLAMMDQLRSLVKTIQIKQAERFHSVELQAGTRKWSAMVLSVLTTGIMLAFLAYTYLVTERNMKERADLLKVSEAARQEAQLALEKETKAHEEAERANRVKDEFLAVVSHELRTPLNAITGWATMLKDSGDTGEVREGVESIERNAHAQARLIDDLLDMSRIMSGKVRLKIQTIEVKNLLVSVIESLRPALNAKELQLQLDFCRESAGVLGDEDRLQQVMWNLLSNAIKFTPKGGTITLAVSRVESLVQVMVKDSGQGFAPEFLPHIFERFSQQDTSTTRRHGGLGLGLAIVKHLVELHGGVVTASSEGLEKGAAFTVKLPVVAVRELKTTLLSDEGESTPTQMDGDRALPDLQDLRVLIVDDQEDTLRLLSTLLGRCHAEVRKESSAPDAYQTLQSWKPDILVSDIGMPGEDGYSLIKRVRLLPKGEGGDTPALALTAFTRKEDAQKALACGYQAHLSKPADPIKLAQVIRHLAHHGDERS
jgi:signal transduction histidine kinase/CheY-like chemotaxis protein